MTVDVTTLSNGMRVVTAPMAHVETTSLGVWVATGARHERPNEHGISHFLEHMAFKGTQTRSARQIAEEIEEVGGELNAATGLDTTAYFARILAGDEHVALGLLADILLRSAFAEEEIEREKEVITQEIASTLDSPDDIAYDLLHASAFPNQALGRTILGTAKSVSAFKRSDIIGFMGRRYAPSAMVVAAAGAVKHDAIVRHVEALFGGLSVVGEDGELPARYAGGVTASIKKFEQTHLLMGFPGPSFRDPSFYAAQVMSGLFGGGMSSRLFQEVRERQGLCYSIYSSAWGLKDIGMMAVHAAASSESLERLVDVVAHELKALADGGTNQRELDRSKAQLKAGLLMALESSSARAEQVARQLLHFGRLIEAAELVAGVDAVTADDVRTLASSYLHSTPTVSVVGSGRKSHDAAKYAADALRLMS